MASPTAVEPSAIEVCETSHADHGNSGPRSVLRAEIAGLSQFPAQDRSDLPCPSTFK